MSYFGLYKNHSFPINTLILLLFLYSMLSAQWFEGNVYLPDSFSGTCVTQALIWNSTDDIIYLRGFNETFVAIDGLSDEKVEPIRIGGNERSNPEWFEWNRANNCLYIWCCPYCAFNDSLHIVDCQTRQTVNIIPFPRRGFGAGNEARLCASSISNKVYLIKENNGAGSALDTLIYVIDGNSHSIIKQIRFRIAGYFYNRYQSLKWNPVNNCLYLIGRIQNNDTNSLAVIDCATDSIITLIPLPNLIDDQNCYALDTIRNRLYVSVSTESSDVSIYEIDCWTNQKIQRIDINNTSYQAIDFILNPTEQKIYYSYLESRSVYFIDIPTGSVIDSTFIGYYFRYLTLYQPEHELYFISNDTVSVVDLSTHSVSHYGLPDEPLIETRPFLHPNRGKLYLSRGPGEAVVIFDCPTKTVRKVIVNGIVNISDILVNPIEHKLYCGCMYRPYVFVFNSETNQPIHQVQVAPKGNSLAASCFIPTYNKAYISYYTHIAVLNCQIDSVVKVINNLISYYLMVYNPILDKVYTLDVNYGGAPISYVIDCRTDSVIKTLNTTWSPDGEGDIEFDSLTNKVYMTGNVGGMVVIDCSSDSVIKRDTHVLRGDIHFRTHGDMRAYAGKGMYDRFNDSLFGYLPFTFIRSEYNSIDDKLYLAQDSSTTNKIYVIDCNSNNLSDSILGGAPGLVPGMFWNKLNNKLYFSPLNTNDYHEPLKVADCRTNQIIATFPQIDRAHIHFKSRLNPEINRFYVYSNEESKLGMIRDNIYGIEEIGQKRREFKIYPTLGRRFNMESDESIVLKIYNPLGEKVAELSSNKGGSLIWDGKDSNGKELNKGVYFILVYPKSEILKPGKDKEQAIKKVVLF
jgi:DNA-binding beta-propeller fold protein YncE